MRTYDYQRYIVGHCSGSTVKHTSPSGIGSYIFRCPDMETQREISSILDNLDDKIEVNRRINDNLEQQAQALFDEVLMDTKLPRNRFLKDYAFVNPARSMKKGEIARYIDMSSLPTKGSFPSDWVDKPYNGGMKFKNGDTLMARITPCLENGKTAYINFLNKDEIAFGSTEYIVMAPHEGIPSEMFYFLARNEDFVSYAVAHMNGSSGRQRVSASDIENYIMPDIPTHLIEQFGMKAKAIMETIKTNSLESRRLAALRDTLLPKLMSGDININVKILDKMEIKDNHIFVARDYFYAIVNTVENLNYKVYLKIVGQVLNLLENVEYFTSMKQKKECAEEMLRQFNKGVGMTLTDQWINKAKEVVAYDRSLQPDMLTFKINDLYELYHEINMKKRQKWVEEHPDSDYIFP